MTAKEAMIPIATVAQRILLLRGQKVMADADLAELYGVETKVLNQAVNYSGAAVFLLPPVRGKVGMGVERWGKRCRVDDPPSHPHPNLPPKKGKGLALWLFSNILLRPE